MARLDSQAKQSLEQSELIGDLLMGAAIVKRDINSSSFEQYVVKAADHIARLLNGEAKEEPQLRNQAREMLDAGRPEHIRPRQCFHWALEFPEVFQGKREGFDAIVSNPPFMGGRLVGRRLGEEYQEYLKIIRNDVRGSPDLCAYFILRAHRLLAANGYMGFLATKSISETGSRAVALDQLIAAGGKIYRANSRMPWPGSAAVVVSVLWVARGTWQGKVVLDDHEVGAIDGGLEEVGFLGRPEKLRELKGRYSQGQDVMGQGFELTERERDELIQQGPKSRKVIMPLFNGQDLNTMPELEPYRWVIYFQDWSEEEAKKYQGAFERVRRLVKPYRESLTGQIHQRCFWKFWDLRPTLMREFAAHDYVLACAQVTKYPSFRRVPTSNVYNHKVKIFFLYEWSDFSVLQSSFHQEWVYWLCGTLGSTTVTYSTSAVLETWPMPSEASDRRISELNDVGMQYHEFRNEVMRSRCEGLTQIYNRVHDSVEQSPDVTQLRALQVKMDNTVAAAYGWSDLELGHDFRATPFGVRFTFAESVRRALLQRLVELNHHRKREEKRRAAEPKRGRLSKRGELLI
jgi:hypothetical protein